MTETRKHTLALFYCQNVPESGEEERQALEKTYGGAIRLFPIPCSGRLEPLHLLRALEEFADAAYVIACPEGACRYFEGNLRARRRVERTRETIAGIGLERERVGIVTTLKEDPKALATLTAEIMKEISELPLSPVFGNSSSPQRQ
ncbi:MAG: hydrogenase iron-sulfur subunit [Pseudomonadota bacterium]